jgi:hypothetical protein
MACDPIVLGVALPVASSTMLGAVTLTAPVRPMPEVWLPTRAPNVIVSSPPLATDTLPAGPVAPDQAAELTPVKRAEPSPLIATGPAVATVIGPALPVADVVVVIEPPGVTVSVLARTLTVPPGCALKFRARTELPSTTTAPPRTWTSPPPRCPVRSPTSAIALPVKVTGP